MLKLLWFICFFNGYCSKSTSLLKIITWLHSLFWFKHKSTLLFRTAAICQDLIHRSYTHNHKAPVFLSTTWRYYRWHWGTYREQPVKCTGITTGRGEVECHLTSAKVTPVLTSLPVPCMAPAAQALKAALSVNWCLSWASPPAVLQTYPLSRCCCGEGQRFWFKIRLLIHTKVRASVSLLMIWLAEKLGKNIFSTQGNICTSMIMDKMAQYIKSADK